MIRKKFIAIYCFLVLISVDMYGQQADDILGIYHLPNSLQVEIYSTGDHFEGKIISVEGFNNGDLTDIHNQDKSKRSDNLMGKIIIHELKFDSESKQWKKGKMYSPDKGIIVNLKVTEVGKDEISIVGSKYFFRKSMKWKKVR